jgi:glutamine synthetase type III
MKSTTGRQEAISAVINYKPLVNAMELEGQTAQSLYGTNVFNDKVMRELLSKPVYKALKRTIERGEKLDFVVADAVASAMKSWALSKGATHFTHVFYPLTSLTACVELSLRRYPFDVRGTRLHRLGRDQPRLHLRKPERQYALYPDRLLLMDR